MIEWAKSSWVTVVLAVASLGGMQAQAPGDPPGAFDAATAAARAPGTTVRIDLIWDSTQTNNAGYGRGFCANVTAKVDCVNMAKGGASTKTFREQGLWKPRDEAGLHTDSVRAQRYGEQGPSSAADHHGGI
jgi:hypothetical protein